MHLFVLRFDFDSVGADMVRLYLDPTDSIESNYTPAASLSAANSDLQITHHGVLSQFTFSGAGHVPGAFDELRWGDTFADVTLFLAPVPEPSSFSLLVLGLVGIGLVARRRNYASPPD